MFWEESGLVEAQIDGQPLRHPEMRLGGAGFGARIIFGIFLGWEAMGDIKEKVEWDLVDGGWQPCFCIVGGDLVLGQRSKDFGGSFAWVGKLATSIGTRQGKRCPCYSEDRPVANGAQAFREAGSLRSCLLQGLLGGRIHE